MTIQTISALAIDNQLIALVEQEARDKILSICTSVELTPGTVLADANEPYHYVYFPVSGFISLFAVAADNPPLGIGLVGNEGMLGVTLLVGEKKSPLQAIVQSPCTAWRMPSEKFHLALQLWPALAVVLKHYIYSVIQQFSQEAVCVNFHGIEARLARWLLMSHDRTEGNTLDLTHVFLARILGVRRSGVSIAAHKLSDKALIAYTRGKIEILDRKGLEKKSCACYKIGIKILEASQALR
ncbi:Crp/Fnr family transcriptional regulator [Simiduia litorea]|uniref:Crp/Fnr family transcriptional regulator n=1 Tax=Simiduia litorea TaxID=1435348 RepID=UPI0036F33E39